MTNFELVAAVDHCLPQTQCTRCGYPSCQAYAIAIVNNEAEINQCPPGGEAGIANLATLLKRPTMPLNPLNGEFKPRQLAVIDEDVCIGCTLCIKACPVDAIIGANKMMHTVITRECSGCDLCIPVCPVDCITMYDDPEQDWGQERRERARHRFDAHQQRRIDEQLARDKRLAEQAQLLKKVQAPAATANDPAVKPATTASDLIAAIMAKAKAKLDS